MQAVSIIQFSARFMPPQYTTTFPLCVDQGCRLQALANQRKGVVIQTVALAMSALLHTGDEGEGGLFELFEEVASQNLSSSSSLQVW